MKHVDDEFVANQIPNLEFGMLSRLDKFSLAIGTPALKSVVALQNMWHTFRTGEPTVTEQLDPLDEQKARIDCGKFVLAASGLIALAILVRSSVDHHST